jgi:hypothetical protein
MHFIKDVKYIECYKLMITFDNDKKKIIDLDGHLENGIFKALKDLSYFKTVRVDHELDTIVWDNGADISPDFLYNIGTDFSSERLSA